MPGSWSHWHLLVSEPSQELCEQVRVFGVKLRARKREQRAQQVHGGQAARLVLQAQLPCQVRQDWQQCLWRRTVHLHVVDAPRLGAKSYTPPAFDPRSKQLPAK